MCWRCVSYRSLQLLHSKVESYLRNLVRTTIALLLVDALLPMASCFVSLARDRVNASSFIVNGITLGIVGIYSSV
jgi:hypothetical protein